MTELQKLYGELRDDGLRHNQAIDELASRLHVDTGTVKRVLQRAEKENGRTRKGNR
jgi:DNA-binding MarR family transcriptional regulator